VSKGGRARAKTLPKSRRVEIAKRAAKAGAAHRARRLDDLLDLRLLKRPFPFGKGIAPQAIGTLAEFRGSTRLEFVAWGARRIFVRKHCSEMRQPSSLPSTDRSEEILSVATIGINRGRRGNSKARSSPVGPFRRLWRKVGTRAAAPP
jgi:hypothetical protein